MFRRMRRAGQELPAEECRKILRNEKRAVLSVIGDEGYPYGVPVNYVYDEAENTVYIHGAKEGHKVDAIRQCSKVCFTVWDAGTREEGDWAFHVQSVIAMGRAKLVQNRAVTEEKVRALALRYYPSAAEAEAELRSGIDRVQLIAVHIEHMTGKRIHER